MNEVQHKQSVGLRILPLSFALMLPATLACGSEQGKRVVIEDSTGRVRIMIGLDEAENPVIKMYGRNGEQEIVRLGAFSEPTMEAEHQNGYGLLIGSGDIAAELGLMEDGTAFCSVRSVGADGASSADLYSKSGAGFQAECLSPSGVESIVDFSTSGVAANGLLATADSKIVFQAAENQTSAEFSMEDRSGERISASMGTSAEWAVYLAQYGDQFIRLRQLLHTADYTIRGQLSKTE